MDREHARNLLTALIQLEAERIVGLASMGRVPGVAPEDLAEIDATMAETLEELTALGVAYPGQVLGARYELSGVEYLIIQLSLLPFHAPDALTAISSLLGEPDALPRLSHAIQLIGPGGENWSDTGRDLMARPVFAHELVRLIRGDDGDPVLMPHPAVAELFGFEMLSDGGAVYDDDADADAASGRQPDEGER